VVYPRSVRANQILHRIRADCAPTRISSRPRFRRIGGAGGLGNVPVGGEPAKEVEAVLCRRAAAKEAAGGQDMPRRATSGSLAWKRRGGAAEQRAGGAGEVGDLGELSSQAEAPKQPVQLYLWLSVGMAY
jgi:hypothetical protein